MMGKNSVEILHVGADAGEARQVADWLAQRGTGLLVGSPLSLQSISGLNESVAALNGGAPSIDLILVDLSRPDGLEAFRRLRWAAPDTPIVVISGTGDEAVAIQAMDEGAQDYLLKSRLDATTLRRSIRYTLERQQVQAALQASERRFRALIEKNAGAIALLAVDGTILYESPAITQFWGRRPEELVGRNAFEFVHPDDVTGSLHLMDQLARTPGLSVTHELRYRHADGTWRWAEATGTNLLHDPDVQGIVVNYRDISERVQAEAALRQKEADLRVIFDSSQQSFILLNLDGTVRAFNRIADERARYKYGRGLEIGVALPDIHGSDGEGWFEASFAKALAGEHSSVEQEFVAPGGGRVWFDIALDPVLSDERRVSGVCLTAADITPRKQAEAEREALLRRNSALVEALGEIVYDWDVPRDEIVWDGQYTRILGYPPAVMGGDRWSWIGRIHPDDLGRIQQEIEAATQARGHFSQEYRVRRPDGGYVWIQDQAVLDIGPQGDLRRMIGVMRDITGRKQAEEALRASEAKFRAMVEASPMGIFLARPDGSPTYYNPAGQRMLGLSLEEALRTSWSQAVHPGDRERVLASWQVAVRTGTPYAGVGRYLHADGAVVWSDVTTAAIKDGDTLLGHVGLMVDITERVQREHEQAAIIAMSAALRTAQTRAEMLPVILEQTAALLGVADVALVARDPATDETVVELACGQWINFVGERLPPGQGISAYIIATGQPFHNNDIRHDPRIARLGAVEEIVAAAVVPLLTREAIIGALSVGSRRPIKDEQVRLLAAIGDIAASALQRATLHDQTERRAAQLAAVSQAGQLLAEALDLEQIQARLYALAMRLLPDTTTLFLSLYDESRQVLTCAFGMHEGAPVNARELPPIPLEPPGVGTQSEAVHTRRPVIVGDLNERLKGVRTNVKVGTPGPRTQSALYMPMLAEGRVIGVLQVQSLAPDRYGPLEAELLAVVANTAAVAIENARLFAEVRLRLEQVQALRAIDVAISGSVDLRVVLNVLLEQATKQLKVDAASLLLLNPHFQYLEHAASRGFRTRAIERTCLRPGDGPTGRMVLERGRVQAPDLAQSAEARERTQALAGEGFQAYYAVPLISKGQVAGVLEAFHREPHFGDAGWLEFLDVLAGQAAIAVENAGLFDRLQRSNAELILAYDATIEGWSRALDLRDKETEGHTQRVMEMSVRLARALGLSEAEILHLRRGALLHDIGKMGVPDAILLKPGPLTEAEWLVMRRHPELAYAMLAPIAYLRPALDIPYSHHEKWDGTGYPRGLKGQQIPLAARIFAVADVWDALKSDRPYRPGWPDERVREHIRREAGQHFDPDIVGIFLRLIEGEQGRADHAALGQVAGLSK